MKAETTPIEMPQAGQQEVDVTLPPAQAQAYAALAANLMQRKAMLADAQLSAMSASASLEGYVVGLCAERQLQGRWMVAEDGRHLVRVG